MRYKSRRQGRLLLATLVASIIAVVAALLLSLEANRPFLPVFLFGNEPASVLFLLLPVIVVLVAGARSRYPTRFVVATAALGAAVTFFLSWVAWIFLFIAECRGGGCFD